MTSQARFGHGGDIESALDGKAGFHRRIIKGADDKVFAVVSLRTSRQFFILKREAPNNFRPGNVSAEGRRNCDKETQDDESTKISTCPLLVAASWRGAPSRPQADCY